METHRTILRLDMGFRDAHNYNEVMDGVRNYLACVDRTLRLPVDFTTIHFVSDAIALEGLVWGLPHTWVLMEATANITEVFQIIGLEDTGRLEYVDRGVCPACGGPFDRESLTCELCGPFDLWTITWRPATDTG